MKQSLVKMLENSIDYAGLFPPAKLPLNHAMRNYLHYLESEERWLLSRFVLPISQVNNLRPFKADFDELPHPIEFSILGSGGTNNSDFIANLQSDLEVIQNLEEQFNALVPMMEIKLPLDLYSTPDKTLMEGLFMDIQSTLDRFEGTLSSIYFEGYFIGDWKNTLATQLAIIKSIREENSTVDLHCKVRTGGTEKKMFPSIAQLAQFIHLVKSNEIAFKATAGLHHPFFHYDPSIGVNMHGFLNVLAAAIFDLSLDETRQLLQEPNLTNFRIEEQSFSWRDKSLATDEIMKRRSTVFHSFGSCSFVEPIEDLQAIGLW